MGANVSEWVSGWWGRGGSDEGFSPVVWSVGEDE